MVHPKEATAAALQVPLQMPHAVSVRRTTALDNAFPSLSTLPAQSVHLHGFLSLLCFSFEFLIQMQCYQIPSYTGTMHNSEIQTQFHAYLPESHLPVFHQYRFLRNLHFPNLPIFAKSLSFHFHLVLKVQLTFLFQP